jgi:hypothetical protein
MPPVLVPTIPARQLRIFDLAVEAIAASGIASSSVATLADRLQFRPALTAWSLSDGTPECDLLRDGERGFIHQAKERFDVSGNLVATHAAPLAIAPK